MLKLKDLTLFVATALAVAFVAGLIFSIAVLTHIALLAVAVLLLCIYVWPSG